jgi:hypothetical protein
MPLLNSVHIICVYRYAGDRGIRCTCIREAIWFQILQYENHGACQDVLFAEVILTENGNKKPLPE